MKDAGTKPACGGSVLACAVLLAWTACSAFGLSLDRHRGCLELCLPQFWIGVDGSEVDAALARKPEALSYRAVMLRLAVGSGNSEAVAALLRAGAPPNLRSETNPSQYILHNAARRNGEVVAALLNGGAFPNPTRVSTPLHEAVRWGRVDAVAELLKAGADPEAKTLSGDTPADLAQRLGNDESVTRLSRQQDAQMAPPCGEPCKNDILALLQAPRPSPRPCGSLCEPKFWKSAERRHIWRAIEKAPAAENWKAPGGNPLHLALKAGAEAATVRLLLDHGADPNGRDRHDDTPLHVAARLPADAEAVALLLARGAKPNIANAKDQTPLHAAFERAPNLDVVRLLHDAGANPHLYSGDSFAATPLELAVSQPVGPGAAVLMLSYTDIDVSELLHAAASGGDPGTVELLLDRGARVQHTDVFGNSAIHAAASAGNTEAMRVLLNHGANPNHCKYEEGYPIVSGEGLRPIHRAVGREHAGSVALLLEFGADPNGTVWTTGETALHYAVSRGSRCQSPTIRLLLANGADPNVQDDDGNTPLHGAVDAGCGKEIFAALLGHGGNPNVRGYRGLTPLDLAKHGLADRSDSEFHAIIRLMENAN